MFKTCLKLSYIICIYRGHKTWYVSLYIHKGISQATSKDITHMMTWPSCARGHLWLQTSRALQWSRFLGCPPLDPGQAKNFLKPFHLLYHLEGWERHWRRKRTFLLQRMDVMWGFFSADFCFFFFWGGGGVAESARYFLEGKGNLKMANIRFTRVG